MTFPIRTWFTWRRCRAREIIATAYERDGRGTRTPVATYRARYAVSGINQGDRRRPQALGWSIQAANAAAEQDQGIWRGLAHLQDLQKLERLEVVNVALRDDNLASLLRFSRLKELELDSSQLSGDSYARLSALHELETIELHGDPIDELRLQGLPKLKSLN